MRNSLKEGYVRMTFCILLRGCYDGNFINVESRVFHKWCSDFWNKEVENRGNNNILRAGYYTWNPKSDITLEALDWLKPGKIHNKVHWNDAMYANSLDVIWGWWGTEQQWKNITEWVLFIEKSGDGYNTYLLANRKEYDKVDQMIIHKLIEILSK